MSIWKKVAALGAGVLLVGLVFVSAELLQRHLYPPHIAVLEEDGRFMPDISERQHLDYFGKIDEETFFVIYTPRGSKGYNFQVYVGPKDKLLRREVVEAGRLRDGGTTHIVTKEGDLFYFPAPPRRNEYPGFELGSHNGKPLLARYR